MDIKRVMVLYGGKADEHAISCLSAANVLRAMDGRRFEAIPIGITKEGAWLHGAMDPRDIDVAVTALPEVRADGHARAVVLDMTRGSDGFLVRGTDGETESLGHVDAVIPVLHGAFGEDGTVQGLLEMMGVPYVGCGVLASAVCMDKHYTKTVLHEAGIRVTPDVTLDLRGMAPQDVAARARDFLRRVREAGLRYPLFVKPSRAGSSFGVTKVEREGDAAELAAAIAEAVRHDWRVLIEQGVRAREIECAVLAAVPGGEVEVSWPGEVVLDRRASGQDQFYDFDSKYMDADSSHVEIPADLPEETLERVRRTALAAFAAVDGAGLARVDSFVTDDGDILVNEINTMPGFTAISMYPKAWQAMGVDGTELITRLIEGVLG